MQIVVTTESLLLPSNNSSLCGVLASNNCIFPVFVFVFFLLQIIFYEERNLQGRSYECNSDCSDIQMHLTRCNSCRVDNGCFVVYDRPNFVGNQVFLKRGEYSDFQCMGSMMGMMGMAMLDTIRSCRMVPMVSYLDSSL